MSYTAALDEAQAKAAVITGGVHRHSGRCAGSLDRRDRQPGVVAAGAGDWRPRVRRASPVSAAAQRDRRDQAHAGAVLTGRGDFLTAAEEDADHGL